MTAPETIGTERLRLLPLLPEHADEMAAVLSDPELYAFIGGAPPTLPDLRAQYERWTAGPADPAVSWWNWVIESRHGGCLTGTVQATVTHRDNDDGGDVAEISWVVGTAWQGRGIATEAARELVSWLRERSVREIAAHIHPDHGASASVAAAAGLVRTDRRHEGEVRWQWRKPSTDLDELRRRALHIHDLYDELNRRERRRVWTREEFMLGFTGDVGDLAKLVMAEEGAREVPGGRAALEHELADCLWSVLILAHRYGVDLDTAFHRTMNELDAAITAKLSRTGRTEGDRDDGAAADGSPGV
jgi:RimJ/RimL family protein N-acetyltransferase